jgi:subtilisin family serine protease
MTTKRYIVALNPDVDYNQFWTEMETTIGNHSYVPDRPVDISDNYDAFQKICEYYLTDQEADILINDPRVAGVEIPVEDNPFVEIVHNVSPDTSNMSYAKPPGIFPATQTYTNQVQSLINWGLIRHSTQSNPYGINTTGTTNLSTTSLYKYVLDGSGVDVVINDTGVAIHPEFNNQYGTSRIVNINWALYSPTPLVGYLLNRGYNDSDGHGTHVAGISTGRLYGWAKNSNIYTLPLNVVDPLQMFATLKTWHLSKGPNGRPTIVNMSWGLGRPVSNYYSLITGGAYQGSSIISGQPASYYQSRGLVQTTQPLPLQNLSTGYLPYPSAVYNTALGELINAGIVVVQASGNNGFKIDVPGGVDYNNYITTSSVPGNLYYHRGSSPTDPRSIVVGAIDTLTSSTGQDQKATYSCAGPRIDVYAAGTYIMSAAPTNKTGSEPYRKNILFKEIILSGTSMAAPQVTGIGALYLQAKPLANIQSSTNCTTVKTWLTDNSTTGTFYSTGNATSYTNNLSLLGGTGRVAYQPLKALGLVQTSQVTSAWSPSAFLPPTTTNIKKTYVKNAGGWAEIKKTWIKTPDGWVESL